MGAQLQVKESLPHGLRRVCQRHVRTALTHLKQPNSTAGIHAVRKDIKKMRAVLGLARGGLKRRQYRKIANAMRLAAKPLSAPRDALVTKNALGKLSPRSAKLFETVRRSLEVYSNLEEHFYQANEIGAVTRYILQKLSKSTAELKTTQSGWRDLHPCLRKSYVRGRRAYHQSVRRPTPENLHAWRKQVKNFREQLNFLCEEWPAKTAEMIRQLKSLGDHLGDDHDLVLLRKFAQEQCQPSGETLALARLIDAKRRELQDIIWQLGSQLYRDVPDQACDQLKKDWKNWRRQR